MLDEDLNHGNPSIVAENSGARPTFSLPKINDLASMTVDELWDLHQTVEAIVAKKIAAEMIVLKRYLDRLSPEANAIQRRSRKPSRAVNVKHYPPVLPKYRNPTQPSETWAGRGRQPRWLKMQLNLGMRLEDLVIR